MNPSSLRVRTARTAGYSLIELLVAMTVMTVVLGATMAGLSDALKANDSIIRMTGLNNTLRAAMDLMVRDLLQVGSGLPPGHVIMTPWGGGAPYVRVPGPPGTSFVNDVDDPKDINAVIPGPGRGPTVNGQATDTLTVLTADNDFNGRTLSAVTDTSVTMPVGVDLSAGDTRVTEGQLMMITKSSQSTLVQVTSVDPGSRVITFAAGDSLRLNQDEVAGRTGNLAALNDSAPVANSGTVAQRAAAVAATTITRIRMISYYVDATNPDHPKLVRRINNGHPTNFDNTLGTAVADDIESLQFTYDLADGATNPSHVRFVAADLTGAGACAPAACNFNQVRKVNVMLTGRSRNAPSANSPAFRNTLTTQVSLRGMAFVNEYQPPQ